MNTNNIKYFGSDRHGIPYLNQVFLYIINDLYTLRWINII